MRNRRLFEKYLIEGFNCGQMNLPIRFAWLKMLLVAVSFVGFWLVFHASWDAWSEASNAWAGVVYLACVVVFVPGWFYLAGIMVSNRLSRYFKRSALFKWLAKYYRNNVRGHILWVWQADEEARDKTESQLQPRNQAPIFVQPELFPNVALGFPMGGWFNRACVCFSADHDHAEFLPMKIQVKYRRCEPDIYVTDTNGTTKKFALLRILDIMQDYVEVTRRHSWSLVWLWTTMLHTFQLALVREREGQEVFLRTTIQELDKGKRFIKSDEGMAIKGKLVTELLTLIPEDDPDRHGFEEFLHDLALKQEKKAAKKAAKGDK